jgi:sulfonate transport system permease protein
VSLREGSGTATSGAAALTAAPRLRAPRKAGAWLAWPRLAVGLILPVAIGVLWEYAAARQWIAVHLLPPPSVIAETLSKLAASGELWLHIGATLERVVWGFFFGALAGTILGALTGTLEPLRRLLDPSLQALRSIPSIAWVPLFILWFGIFELSKIVLIAVGVFFPVYLALAAAIHNVDRKLVEVGRAFRFGRLRLVTRILIPAALPTYLIGLRGGLGLGWMFVVAAELMGASEGLGFLLLDGQQTGRASTIIAAILLFAILGKTSDWLLAMVSSYVLRWQDSYQAH